MIIITIHEDCTFGIEMNEDGENYLELHIPESYGGKYCQVPLVIGADHTTELIDHNGKLHSTVFADGSFEEEE